MPDNKPFLALKNAGIQADPDPMMQFRTSHPWLAGAADLLTGGATDPYSRPGPLDVATTLPMIPGLSRLPASLEHVTGLLRDIGYGEQETSPAVRALTEAFNQPIAEPDYAALALGQKVTGLRPAARTDIRAPEGFTFGGRGAMTLARPTGREALARQIRGYYSKMGGKIPEVVPASPAVRGLDELRDLNVSVTDPTEQAPLLQAKGRGRQTRQVTPGRVPFAQLTSEDIKEIQRSAGSGMNQKQLMEKYPQYTKETLGRAVKMPWKD